MGCVVAAADPPRSIPFAIARRNHRVKVRQLPNGRPLSIIKAETGTFETARQIKTVRRWAVLSDEEQTKRGIPIPGEYLLSLQSRPNVVVERELHDFTMAYHSYTPEGAMSCGVTFVLRFAS